MKTKFIFGFERKNHSFALLAPVMIWMGAAAFSDAATLTWTGGAAALDSDVLSAANWSGGVAPKLSGDAIIFSGSTKLAPTLAAALSVTSLSFSATASSFTLGGGGVYTLTAAGGIVNSSANTQTISNALVFAGNQTWATNAGAILLNGAINNNNFTLTLSNNTAGKTTTISGVLSGAGGLTKTRAATLVLNGANTYLGATTLSAGQVVIGNNTAFGTSVVNFNGAAISAAGGDRSMINAYSLGQSLTFGGSSALTLSGAGSFSANRTVTVNGTGILSLTGNLTASPSRSITKAGVGTLVLSGNNTMSSFTLTSGTLLAGNASALGTGTVSLGSATFGTTSGTTTPLTFTNAVTLAGNTNFTGSTAITFNGAATLTATRALTLNGIGPVTFGGVVSGATFGITQSGIGNLILAGNSANTYSGLTRINEGKLTLSKSAGNAVAGNLQVGNGSGANSTALVQLTAANQILDTSAVSILADGELSLQTFADTVGALTLFGGSVTGTGTGVLGLGGDLTFSGTSGATALISSGLMMTDGRIFAINSNGLTFGMETVISGALSGGFAATKTGAGTLVLSGNNTFSGGFSANAGNTLLGSSNALGTVGANLGDIAGANTSNTSSFLFTPTSTALILTNAITVRTGSSGALTLGGLNTAGVNTFSGALALGRSVTLTAAAGGEVAFSGAVSGAGGFSKLGLGTIRLSGANSSTGAMTISTGTLALGGNGALGSGTLTLDGGVLAFGADRTATTGIVTLSNGSSITGSGTSTLTSTGFDLSSGLVQIALAGSGNLTKSTSGTVTLSGSNTYSGTTTISAGNLLLGKINALPTNTTLSVGVGAVLNLQNFDTQVGSLAGAGNVQLGNGIFTAGGNGTTTTLTTFSGITSGTGGLTKIGPETLTLSGSNSYSGATLVSVGTLALGKTDALSSLSPVTVNSTFNLGTFSQTLGSLAGSGSVVMGGGTLRVGAANSPTTFSGVISGTGSLVKLGSGVLTLTGINTTTAALDLNAGAIILSGVGGSLASASSVTLRSGSTLQLDNSVTENANRLSNSAAIQMDGGTLRLISDDNGTTETVGNLIVLGGSSNVNVVQSGAGASILTFSGLGSLALGATVNFTATTPTGAILALGSSSTGPQILITGQPNGLLGSWARVGADFAEYFTLGIRAYSDYYDGDLGVNYNSNEKIIRLRSSSPAGALVLTNAGVSTGLDLAITDVSVLSLGDSNTRSLNLLDGGIIKSTTTGTVIQGSGILTAGGAAAKNLNVSVMLDANLTINSVIANNLAGGTVGVAKSGRGTLTLGGTNTFSGNVLINDGVLVVSSDANLGTGTKNLTFNGGTLRVATGFTVNDSKAIVVAGGLTGTLDVASSQTLTLANVSGRLASGDATSSLIKTGDGSLVIQNANAGFSGMLRIDQGTTEARHASSLGTGLVQLNGGTLSLVQDTSTAFNNNIVMLADSTVRVAQSSISGSDVHTLGDLALGSRTLTVTGDGSTALQFTTITLGGTGTLNPTTAAIRAGVIGGSFGLTKTGAGALILVASNNYTGSTTINGGTLRLGISGAISDASAVTLASGTSLDLAGFSDNIGALAGPGNVTLGVGTLTTGAITSDFGGVISGAGSLVKTGAGTTFTLSGSNTFTGETLVSGGTLAMNGVNRLSASSALNVAAGATVLLNGNATTASSLLGAGTVALGSGTFTTGSVSSTFSGDFTGTGGLVKSGSGVLTLSGTSTYSGATSITNGSIVMRSSDALGSAAGTVSVSSGASLNLENGVAVNKSLSLAGTGVSGSGALVNNSGVNAWSGTVTLAAPSTITNTTGTLSFNSGVALGNSQLTLAGAGTTTFSNSLSGTAAGDAIALTKTGTGTAVLSGVNTYTGVTQISEGVLKVDSSTALGATGAGNGTVVSSGATLLLERAFSVVIGNELLTLNGTGAGGNGALHSLSGENVWNGAITLASESILRVDAGSLKINGELNESGGARSLTKTGAGTLILLGAAVNTGSVLVQGGTLQLAAADRINDLSAVNVSSGATFDLNNSNETIGSLAGSGAVTLGLDADIGGGILTTGGDSTSTTYSGIISGVGSFAKIGTGTQTLSGSSTYTGFTLLSGGILSVSVLGNGGVSGNIGAATNGAANLVLDGGTLRYTGAAQSTDRNFTIDLGGGTFDASGTSNTSDTGALTLSGAATMATPDIARTLTLAGTNTGANTLSAALTDSGTGVTSLAKTGIGTWVLGGASTYTGTTTINGGTLRLGSAGRIGDSSALIVTSGTFDLASFAETIGSLSGGGSVTLGSAALTTGGDATSTTFSGSISGTGDFIKTGIGVQTLSGTSSYTGATSINGGTLSVANLANGGVSSGIGASSNLAANLVLNGGTLRYTGATQTSDRNFTIGTSGGTFESSGIGSLSLTGAATLSGNNTTRTLTFGGTNTGANTFSAALSNNGNSATSLVKNGTGSWQLTGANTYTGTTSINEGTLTIGGSLAATPVTVAATAILANNGSIAGATTVNGTLTGSGTFSAGVTINSTHRPGNGVGVQTFASGLTYASSAVLAWELSKNSLGVAGTDFDQVRLTGGVLNVASGAVIDLSFNAAGSTVNFANNFWSTSKSWSVVALSGTSTASVGNAAFTLRSISADSLGNGYSPYGTFSTTITNNGGHTLNWNAVPEPGVAVLFALSASVLLRRRR